MDFSQYEKINEGNEAVIYRKDKYTLMKIYKNPSLYNDGNVKKLVDKQSVIENTILPIKPLYKYGQFIGCLLYDFTKLKSFHSLKWEKDQLVKIEMLEILKNNLQELTDNHIYHQDLDDLNILINKKAKVVEIIDLEGMNTIIKDSEDINALNILLIQYRTLMLELLYKEYDCFKFHKKPISTLKQCGLSSENISLLLDKDFGYKNISLFLNNIKKDKIKSI